jgi:hypothetical protein
MAATAAVSHHGMRFAFVEDERPTALSILAITVKWKQRHRRRQRLSQKEEGG